MPKFLSQSPILSNFILVSVFELSPSTDLVKTQMDGPIHIYDVTSGFAMAANARRS